MSNDLFGPFSGGSFPGDPLNTETVTVICCPVCKSENFRAYSNQYGIFRICKDCSNEWSGGTSGVLMDPSNNHTSPPGIVEIDEYPVQPYLGPEFPTHYEDEL